VPPLGACQRRSCWPPSVWEARGLLHSSGLTAAWRARSLHTSVSYTHRSYIHHLTPQHHRSPTPIHFSLCGGLGEGVEASDGWRPTRPYPPAAAAPPPTEATLRGAGLDGLHPTPTPIFAFAHAHPFLAYPLSDPDYSVGTAKKAEYVFTLIVLHVSQRLMLPSTGHVAMAIFNLHGWPDDTRVLITSAAATTHFQQSFASRNGLT
jgi:hypothetical protein